MHCTSFYTVWTKAGGSRQQFTSLIVPGSIVLIALKGDNRCQLIDFNRGFFFYPRRIAWCFKLPAQGEILPDVALGASMPDGRKINRRLCLFSCSQREIRKM
jgi:hypothetical protein